MGGVLGAKIQKETCGFAFGLRAPDALQEGGLLDDEAGHEMLARGTQQLSCLVA